VVIVPVISVVMLLSSGVGEDEDEDEDEVVIVSSIITVVAEALVVELAFGVVVF